MEIYLNAIIVNTTSITCISINIIKNYDIPQLGYLFYIITIGDEMNIDIERLKGDLMDYFGTATSIYPVAIMKVIEVENASYDKLIEIARCNGFNLDNYVIGPYTKSLFR